MTIVSDKALQAVTENKCNRNVYLLAVPRVYV